MKKISKSFLLFCFLLLFTACNDTPDYALVAPKNSAEEEKSAPSSKKEASPKRDTSKEKPEKEDPSAEEKKEVLVFEDQPYETEAVVDDSLLPGERVVVQEGSIGQSEVTYEITYRNGEETRRIAKSERIIKNPVNEIVHIGPAVAEEEPVDVTVPASSEATWTPTYTDPSSNSEASSLPEWSAPAPSTPVEPPKESTPVEELFPEGDPFVEESSEETVIPADPEPAPVRPSSSAESEETENPE